MTIKRLVSGTILLVLLAVGYYGYRLMWARPYNIDHFADRWVLLVTSHYPELLTFLGVFENTPLDRHSDRLSDLSPANEQRLRESAQRQAELFSAYSRSSLTASQTITYDKLEWVIDSVLRLGRYPYHFDIAWYLGPYPINTTSGAQFWPLETLDSFQRVEDEDSARRFLSRVKAIPEYVDALVEGVRYRETLAVAPPKIIVEQLVAEAENLLANEPEEWSIRQSFFAAVDDLKVSAERATELKNKMDEAVIELVIPAYQSYLDYLVELQARAPDEVGLWVLPDGEGYYRDLLAHHTTTALSADEIHQLGLLRVEELTRQSHQALDTLAIEPGALVDRLAWYDESTDYQYSNGENIKREILADLASMQDALVEGVAEAFPPRVAQPLEIRPVPAYKESNAPGAYYNPPSMDGTRAGVFFINLREPASTRRHRMLTLSAHEGVPGHHFENVSAHALEGVPLFRKVSPVTAYSEGWGLYAERLVYELGLHDSHSNLGRLQDEMFRAVRLVVDTGIHSKRWSRQKAIDYMISLTGMPESEVVAEIDRYISEPGQACAYMVGMLQLLDMREEARRRLGDQFSLAEFHHAVLKNGPLPMPLVREQVRLMGTARK